MIERRNELDLKCNALWQCYVNVKKKSGGIFSTKVISFVRIYFGFRMFLIIFYSIRYEHFAEGT